MFSSADRSDVLSSPFLSPFVPSSLSTNPDFEYLRSEIEKLPKQSPIFLTLNRLLTEVTFTFSESLQHSMLAKIKNWFWSKIPKEQTQAPIYQSTQIQKQFQSQIKHKSETFSFNSSQEANSPKVPYIPKRYKTSEIKKKKKSENNNLNETLNTRASSSEPSNHDRRRRMTQSPGIIKCIVNNFVKNKRTKMYNFTLEAFLDESKGGIVVSKPGRRPMSSMMKKQIEEVAGIKQKLSSRGVRCRMQELYHGYVLDDRDNVDGLDLPRGGERLISKPVKMKDSK